MLRICWIIISWLIVFIAGILLIHNGYLKVTLGITIWWVTLNAISSDIDRYKKELEDEYCSKKEF